MREMSDKSPLIVAIGNVSVDLSLKVSSPPKRGGEVLASEFYLGGGGAASNMALAVARLGLKARFLGCVGDDEYSSLALKELMEEGVDLSFVKTVKRGTGVVVVLVEESGERTMIAYRGANLEVSEKLVTQASIGDATSLHISSLSGTKTLKILKRARSINPKLICSYDPGGSVSSEDVMACLRHLNILLLNCSELRELTGAHTVNEGVRVLTELNPELLIVVKEGARGSSLYRGELYWNVPAFDVRAVDTTGAGDSFNAAFLVGYHIGLSPNDLLVFSNAAAALKVKRRGARAAPTLDEVLKFLKEKGFGKLSNEIRMRIRKATEIK